MPVEIRATPDPPMQANVVSKSCVDLHYTQELRHLFCSLASVETSKKREPILSRWRIFVQASPKLEFSRAVHKDYFSRLILKAVAIWVRLFQRNSLLIWCKKSAALVLLPGEHEDRACGHTSWPSTDHYAGYGRGSNKKKLPTKKAAAK
eukprot:IDg16776t1